MEPLDSAVKREVLFLLQNEGKTLKSVKMVQENQLIKIKCFRSVSCNLSLKGLIVLLWTDWHYF